jgi:hypothetical protein
MPVNLFGRRRLKLFHWTRTKTRTECLDLRSLRPTNKRKACAVAPVSKFVVHFYSGTDSIKFLTTIVRPRGDAPHRSSAYSLWLVSKSLTASADYGRDETSIPQFQIQDWANRQHSFTPAYGVSGSHAHITVCDNLPFWMMNF